LVKVSRLLNLPDLDKMHLIFIDKNLILLRISNGGLRVGGLQAIALMNVKKDVGNG
jgi:hypothetical protein